VTSHEFRERLLARAENAGVSIAADAEHQLEAYYRVLVQWNAKINLTALPLSRPTNQTFDRLLIEPLVAARYVAEAARKWFDIGSGGGSPAIPLKIVQPHAKLTMIESKARKAAFLREAIRAVGLSDVRVESERFEEVAPRTEPQTIDLVTVRAVKSDPALLAGIGRILSPVGRVFLFHSPEAGLKVPSVFAMVEMARLGTSGDARLSILRPLFP
jgi:16S rRNA (guanine527-N7)-methyltransferase